MERAAERILSVLDCTDAELSIAVVDDEEIRRLNREYRSIDTPTDVLSFPMMEGEFAEIEPKILGDVVISADAAQKLAREHSLSMEAVLDLLLVHGVLHLVDYDHDTPEDAVRMDRKTLELLADLGHDTAEFRWYETASPYANPQEGG